MHTLAGMEIPPIPSAPRWANVRQKLGISAFGINAWTAQTARPGARMNNVFRNYS